MENALAVQELFPALRSGCEDAGQLILAFERRRCVSITRLCLGASFCGSLFNAAARPQFDFFGAYCRDSGLKVSLAVPIFTQRELARGKEIIDELLREYGDVIDEAAVNDPGMYRWLRGQFAGKLFAGRLMNKVNRDPRYPEYGEGAVLVPRPPVAVSGIELDACASHMIVEDGDELTVCVYTPYSYISTGKICSFASLYADAFQKFAPAPSCPVNCGKYYVRHECRDKVDFYHIGNAVYYPSELPRISGAAQLRAIWFPLELWEVRE